MFALLLQVPHLAVGFWAKASKENMDYSKTRALPFTVARLVFVGDKYSLQQSLLMYNETRSEIRFDFKNKRLV